MIKGAMWNREKREGTKKKLKGKETLSTVKKKESLSIVGGMVVLFGSILITGTGTQLMKG